jgi:hypothetical protein
MIYGLDGLKKSEKYMENWQARVIEEQQLLNGKIERLENTLFDPEKIKKIEVDQLPPFDGMKSKRNASD